MQAERPDTTGEPTSPTGGHASPGGSASPDDLPEFLAVNRTGLPGKVFDLRRKLYRKAKREPAFRFYTLYEAVCRADVLRAAWDRVAANDGAPGVDGLTIKQVVQSPAGVEGFIAELQQALRSKTYRPQPVKRVSIPKADGRTRPLGIPTVRDRVAQTAALLVLEPIFEADFLECSFGFRPCKSAHQALEEVGKNLRQGRRQVYDADLTSYFDTIPHDNLMKCVEQRVSDRSVLALIRAWLKAVVVEPGGGPGDPPRWARPGKGTPQGGVISPLLANLYLHWFDRTFHRGNGPWNWADARLVRYADDFVILAKYVGGRIGDFAGAVLEGRMGLSIHRGKTRTAKLSEPGESLDFLGYTFRYDRDLRGRGHHYLNVFPSRNSQQRARDAIREMTGPAACHTPVAVLIGQVNAHLRGWGSYFGRGYPSRAFRRIDHYARERLIRHLSRRSQRPFRPPDGVSWYQHLQRLGLESLAAMPLNAPR